MKKCKIIKVFIIAQHGPQVSNRLLLISDFLREVEVCRRHFYHLRFPSYHTCLLIKNIMPYI